MNEHYCANCKYAEYSNIGLLCMGHKGMPHTSQYSSCDSWKSAKPTNADRIRAMSDEELAAWIAEHPVVAAYDNNNQQHKRWLEWLKQEAKE